MAESDIIEIEYVIRFSIKTTKADYRDNVTLEDMLLHQHERLEEEPGFMIDAAPGVEFSSRLATPADEGLEPIITKIGSAATKST